MLVLSLFPGIGLLNMAFEEEGFTVVRGPDVLWGGDIRRFHVPRGKFDGIIGGPPCQTFSSLAHLVRANGHEPKFGNLIPEFVRCIEEGESEWFVMENVPQAPTPTPKDYGVRSFMLNNAWLLGEGGFGQEQERLRKFVFGLRGADIVPNLMRWIDVAALMLPETERTATQWQVDNSDEKKRRKAVFGDGRPTRREHRHPELPSSEADAFCDAAEAACDAVDPEGAKRYKAVTSKLDQIPVRLGGSGKRKKTVTASDGGKSVRMSRYTFADALRLQGLPENFLADAPFTVAGKLRAVANGVPLPMGRAIAKAVKEAIKS